MANVRHVNGKKKDNHLAGREAIVIGVFLFFLFAPEFLLIPFPSSSILNIINDGNNYWYYLVCILIVFAIVEYLQIKRKQAR